MSAYSCSSVIGAPKGAPTGEPSSGLSEIGRALSGVIGTYAPAADEDPNSPPAVASPTVGIWCCWLLPDPNQLPGDWLALGANGGPKTFPENKPPPNIGLDDGGEGMLGPPKGDPTVRVVMCRIS